MLQRLTLLNARHAFIAGSVSALLAIGGCLSSDFSVSPTEDASAPKDGTTTPGDDSTGDDDSPSTEDGSTSTTDATTDEDGGIADSGYAPPAPLVSITRADGGFSIDSTEVTQAQYQQFLIAKGGDTSGQPTPACDFNLSYLPNPGSTANLWDPVNHANWPVTRVDWCDAHAYCAWAGKHLCSGFGGTTIAYSDGDKPAASQWMYACTKGGVQSYPYGTSDNPTACNVNKPPDDGGVVQDVGSNPKCVGGFPGVSDMVGNATEWIDACDGTGSCVILGGSWGFPGYPATSPVQCGQFTASSRSSSFDDLGFRCCKD